MGRYLKGILGPFQGKVGTVIGSSWNGIDYMKSLPKASTKAATPAQLDQQSKFTIAAGFLQPISGLLNKGFKSVANGASGYNMASSHLLKNCLMGAYPNYHIDYGKVLFSRGDLTGAWSAAVVSNLANSLTFSWIGNAGYGISDATDKAVILVYNPDKQQFVSTMDGAERNTGTYDLYVPEVYSGDTVECWISFISADGKQMATSVYAGSALVK